MKVHSWLWKWQLDPKKKNLNSTRFTCNCSGVEFFRWSSPGRPADVLLIGILVKKFLYGCFLEATKHLTYRKRRRRRRRGKKRRLTHDMFVFFLQVSQSNKWSFVEASAQFSANKNNIKNQYFFGVSICFCSNLPCSSLVLSASSLVRLREIRNAQKRGLFFSSSPLPLSLMANVN